ncbi:MAG: DUF2274 domain-containing protein [Sphingomonas sp.]|nr:DUF2274 domain-containing protein [Sphingomonas sp.]
MAGLRLGRLPDRTPVKVTIGLAPELHEALVDYAALYEETYGRAEPVQELIPAMLAGFLEGDRLFARRRRERRS